MCKKTHFPCEEGTRGLLLLCELSLTPLELAEMLWGQRTGDSQSKPRVLNAHPTGLAQEKPTRDPENGGLNHQKGMWGPKAMCCSGYVYAEGWLSHFD